ncbi:MAG: cytochrome c [Isosphaeraceae bacterium]|nr:cytochrome c [Isosphaeraceae bacterium]
MRFRVLLAGALAVVVAAVVAGRADADNAETPSIKQVMVKLHKGANAPVGKLKGELKGEKPNWDTIQKQTKEIVVLSAALAKNEPSKGDAASWKKLSDEYFQDAKALDDAAQAKDLAAAKTAHGRLSASCKACHSVHKGK